MDSKCFEYCSSPSFSSLLLLLLLLFFCSLCLFLSLKHRHTYMNIKYLENKTTPKDKFPCIWNTVAHYKKFRLKLKTPAIVALEVMSTIATKASDKKSFLDSEITPCTDLMNKMLN